MRPDTEQKQNSGPIGSTNIPTPSNPDQEESQESLLSTEPLYSEEEEEDEIADCNPNAIEEANTASLLARWLPILDGLFRKTCQFMIDHENLYFSCSARSAAILKDFIEFFKADRNPDKEGEYIISAKTLKDNEHSDLSGLEASIKSNHRKLELFLEVSHILGKSNHKNTEEGLKLSFSSKKDSDAFISILKKSLPDKKLPNESIYRYDFIFDISEEKLKLMKEDAQKDEDSKRVEEEKKLLTEKMVYEFQTQFLFLVDRKKWRLEDDCLCLSGTHPKFQVILLRLFEPHGLKLQDSILKIKTEAIVKLPSPSLNELVSVTKDYQMCVNTFASLVRKLWPEGKSEDIHQNEGFEFPHKMEWQYFFQKNKLTTILRPSSRGEHYRLIRYTDVLNLGREEIKRMLEEATKMAKAQVQAAALPQAPLPLLAPPPEAAAVKKSENPYPQKKAKETSTEESEKKKGKKKKNKDSESEAPLPEEDKITKDNFLALIEATRNAPELDWNEEPFKSKKAEDKDPTKNPALVRAVTEEGKLRKITPCHWICLLSFELAQSNCNIDCIPDLWNIYALSELSERDQEARSESVTKFLLACGSFTELQKNLDSAPEEREEAFVGLVRQTKNLHKKANEPSCLMSKDFHF